jgi:hypothetical protein
MNNLADYPLPNYNLCAIAKKLGILEGESIDTCFIPEIPYVCPVSVVSSRSSSL